MKFASLRQRIGAFLLDYLIISLYMVLLGVISFGLGSGPLQGAFAAMFANQDISQLSAFLLLVLPVILYFSLLESSAWHASLGKRKLGMCVVDQQGAQLTFAHALVRNLIKFLPWELTHACLWRIPGWPLAPVTPSPLVTAGLILVWVLVAAFLISMVASPKRQALYDRIAGTVVIAGQCLVR